MAYQLPPQPSPALLVPECPWVGTAASPEQALAFYSKEVSCPGCPCYMNEYTAALQPTAANLRGVSAAFPPSSPG